MDTKPSNRKYFVVVLVLVVIVGLFVASYTLFNSKTVSVSNLENKAIEQGTVEEGEGSGGEEPGQYEVQQLKAPSEKGLQSFRVQAVNLPKNPTSASAVCGATNKVIISGQQTDCGNPVFTWPRVNGAVGYFVYWYEEGDADPQRLVSGDEIVEVRSQRPAVVTRNRYELNQGFLVSGNSYKLMVQTVTAKVGTEMAGGEVIDDNLGIISDAKTLFVYNYQ